MFDAKAEAASVLPEVIEWRRHLHENPEIGFDLPNTVKFVCDKLDEFGLPYKVDQGSKCSVVAEINPGAAGRCIALRADMDALPVKEETGLPFASKVDGRMHACGHDAHTACLLGTAKVLAAHKDEIHGRVKLIFQPAEELGTGSVGICESGALDDVDEIVGMHVGNINAGSKPGTLVFARDAMMATMDKFTIDVVGKGAHGALPHLSVDPVVIGSYIVCAIQEMIPREIDATEPVVVTTGVFQSGTAFNVIPDTAHLEGTTRVLHADTRDFVERRLGEIATNVAKAYRAEVVYKFFRQPPPLVNTPEVVDKVMACAKELYPEDTVYQKKPVMGGEDFAWYLEKKPGCFFLLQNPKEIDGQTWGQDNCKFALAEEYFDRPIAVYTGYVMNQLG